MARWEVSDRFHLTPVMLAAAYEFVATLPPFSRWKMPPADQVEFFVTRNPKKFGEYGSGATVAHRIYISDATVGSPAALVPVIAHEMVHLYQAARGKATQSQHNEDFKRLARIVCRRNSYDYKAFV